MASIFAALRRMLAVPAVLHGDMPGSPSVASPYSHPNHLAHALAPEWFPRVLDRDTAMRIPAVARARLVICSTIAATPMRAYRGDTELSPQPTWIDRTAGPISPYHRMLWTVDDLLFYGMSLWAVQRGAAGQVIAADRVPWESWRIDGPNGNRVVFTERDPETGAPIDHDADPASIVLIPGNDSGLLEHGADVLTQALALSRSVSRYVSNPSAYLELHQTNDTPVSDAERDRIVSGWVAARRGENGGVAFTSSGIEVREHGAATEHLLIEGRTAAALDIARAVGIPGAIVDAIQAEGLTYQNADSKRDDLHTYGLASYTSAIGARLGLDDVSPAGQSIAFVTPAGNRYATPDDGASSAPANVVPIRQNGGA